MSNLSVICHVYNEEYLLAFWLEHHVKIFDYGVIIDYCSTDGTSDLVHRICPHWKVVRTRNINHNGTPNFDADLIDNEVKDIESTIEGNKICLNATEFLVYAHPYLTSFRNTLDKNLCHHIPVYSVASKNYDFYPKNIFDFFKNITHISDINRITGNYFRFLHTSPKYNRLNYTLGRHGYDNDESLVPIERTDVFILHMRYYPLNNKMIERRLQIQNNIPEDDKKKKQGWQHIVTKSSILIDNENMINNVMIPIEKHPDLYIIKPILDKFSKEYSIDYLNFTKFEYIHYHELIDNSKWGNDYVMLDSDINLFKNTDIDKNGYKIFDIDNYNELLQNLLKTQILNLTNKDINLKDYHNQITDYEHTLILNAMPYKKTMNNELNTFSLYLENMISTVLNDKIKIFNDDLWIRICRPSNISNNDFNPCHRDVYLDFYRNIVNIYLPIEGSNELSALTIQPGSHKWNENQTRITEGGAFFPSTNKKYSVDAIAASKIPLNMIRPNPSTEQLMLFSPYLIHGCANNNNPDTTRISLEVRFIRDDENGKKQEDDFNEFLKIRNWR